jgi:hypothetical protein
MKKKILAALTAALLVLCGWTTAFAQEEDEKPPYVTPVDTFTCSYNDGQGPGDLDKAIANWNGWMDDQGATDYGAITLTPYYHGADTFDTGIDNYLANGRKTDDAFNKAITCETHEHWATINVKEPKEGPPPDNFVLMFSNCTVDEDTEWPVLKGAIDKAVDYMTEQNFGNGAWMMWPVFGGEGDPDWDFKWVTSYDNYTDFGKAYQHNANGGGRQAMREIMGEMLDCDTSRVYNAKTVRRITATDGDE